MELIFLLVTFLSLALFSLAVHRISRGDLDTRTRAHFEAFRTATDPGHLRLDLPDWRRERLRVAGTGLYPSSPSDLSVASIPNTTAEAETESRVASRAGIFGRLGPVQIRRRAAMLREAWTINRGPASYTQSARATSGVRAWFDEGLDASLGRVRDGLKLAD
jgi:hypothetical protein